MLRCMGRVWFQSTSKHLNHTQSHIKVMCSPKDAWGQRTLSILARENTNNIHMYAFKFRYYWKDWVFIL